MPRRDVLGNDRGRYVGTSLDYRAAAGIGPSGNRRGIIEWQRTLSGVEIWAQRTVDGEQFHVSLVGHGPEHGATPVTVTTGLFAYTDRLGYDLDPGAIEQLLEDVLYAWLGAELTHSWPFESNRQQAMATVPTNTGATS